MAEPITGSSVRCLRDWTLRRLRAGDERPVVEADALPAGARTLAGNYPPAQVRWGLAWLAVVHLPDLGVDAAAVWLWIEHSGLRGVPWRTSELASGAHSSRRRIERAIATVDAPLARTAVAVGAVPVARWAQALSSSLDQSRTEGLEVLRAEAFSSPNPARALDAIEKFLRSAATSSPRRAYVGRDKDHRYRDAPRVHGWAATSALHPPTRPGPAYPIPLIDCHGVQLAKTPHDALGAVSNAIIEKRPDVVPVLLAHAGTLIPHPYAAGVDAWLSLLQLNYHAAMEAEHITALLWARAWQGEAARLRGPGDPRIRSGLAGRGHALQMFGHYTSAIRLYREVIDHAHRFRDRGDDDPIRDAAVHDAYGQIAYCHALAGSRSADAAVAVRQMNVLADRLGNHDDVQFTRARRIYEISIARAVDRSSLTLRPAAHGVRGFDEISDQFFAQAKATDKANRRLAGADLLLLHAVADRNRELVEQARDQFQQITNDLGGYANLTDRFNTRLAIARRLCGTDDVAPVSGPADSLRQAIGLPRRSTGLLVAPMSRC